MSILHLEKRIRETIKDDRDRFFIAISTDEGTIQLNADQQVRAASVVKVPIMIEAFRQVEAGSVDPDQQIDIDEGSKVGGCGVIKYLTRSNRFTFRNLLELMVIVSDNTAANLVLDKVGMNSVNQLFEQLGCRNTQIERKFMDAEAIEAGRDNYTSASDMVTLLKVIGETNALISQSSRSQMLDILSRQQFRQKLPCYSDPDSGVRFYNKTGEIPGVEHDVAIVQRGKARIYAAVLTQGWQNNGMAQQYLAEIGKHLIAYMS